MRSGINIRCGELWNPRPKIERRNPYVAVDRGGMNFSERCNSKSGIKKFRAKRTFKKIYNIENGIKSLIDFARGLLIEK